MAALKLLLCVATCNFCKYTYIACDWNTDLAKLQDFTVLCQLRVMPLKKLFTGWGSRSSKMTSKTKICPCWHAQLDTIPPLGCVCPYSEPQLLASVGRPKWDISLTRLCCFSKETHCYFKTEAVQVDVLFSFQCMKNSSFVKQSGL